MRGDSSVDVKYWLAVGRKLRGEEWNGVPEKMEWLA